jgi:Leucine-rich repeat (LRR) protein
MKSKFFYIIAIAATVMFTANASVLASGQITLNFNYAGKVTLGLAGSGTATIDWGDGSRVETVALKFSPVPFYHNYSGATPRTITINGESIRGIICTDMQITAIDVSKCPSLSILDCSRNNITSLNLSNNLLLRHLTCTHNKLSTIDVSKITWIAHIRCSHNQITSLDFSNNVAIKSLYCDHNQLNSAAMEKFLTSLHSNTINGGKAIYISDNPGLTSAVSGLARQTGWTISGLTN